MNLENIFKDAKTDWESQEYLLVDEYDEDGNLITILKYDEGNVVVHLHDVKGQRALHHKMTNKEFHILDFGNFKRLIDELFYYAQ